MCQFDPLKNGEFRCSDIVSMTEQAEQEYIYNIMYCMENSINGSLIFDTKYINNTHYERKATTSTAIWDFLSCFDFSLCYQTVLFYTFCHERTAFDH